MSMSTYASVTLVKTDVTFRQDQKKNLPQQPHLKEINFSQNQLSREISPLQHSLQNPECLKTEM